ncbi:hypothetical protein NEOLEDRAFT_1140938 [Neolentinus lepideus HHB14362 ss-1]|uniref:GmrSD restriction endonucleases N-terminal domain-containing protein n=1 Tax=Neolentinus lepideus HHB14362 ss-1 TaxID=1314782 RepID=A0A165P044_9AGAM|nr:hypothetical protein NEOLEDRAFT_1140938 [Neolentinus lepideus HHB14362 ss-1]
MSSDASDITDMDYEEEDIEKPQTRLGKAGTAANVRKMRKVLSKPRTVHYTPQSLYEQIHNADIDLNPDYQREVVWPEVKQSALVDSLMRHYYVPPVILAVKVDEEGAEHRTCIDGKQRLTSIQKFMDGLVPFKDPWTNEKYWFKDDPTSTRARKILPERYRKEWSRLQIVCIEYDGLLESEEREIFQRVQLGMALTPAEKLQAISSPKADFVRELLATYSELTGNSSTLVWDSGRGTDFRCFAQALYNVEKFPKLKSGGTIAQIEKWLATKEDFDENTQDDIHRTYSVFLELAKDKQLAKCFKHPTNIAPVEFVIISVLIAREKDRLSLVQLSRVIRDMRLNVRDEHKDIRLNSAVAKTMLAFIGDIGTSHVKGEGEPAGKMVSSVPKRKRKNGDGSGEKVQKGPQGTKLEVSRNENGMVPVSGVFGNPAPPSQVKQLGNDAHTNPTLAASRVSSLPSGGSPASPAVPDRLAAIRSARLGASQARTPPTAPAADRASSGLHSGQYPSQQAASLSASPSINKDNHLDTSLLAKMDQNPSPYNHQSPSQYHMSEIYQGQGRGEPYHQYQDERQGSSQQGRDERDYGKSSNTYWTRQDGGGRGYGR